MLLVELWPGARPYIGGSQTNSVLELTLGYNGFGRLTGDEVGSVGGGGWGRSGWLRLLGSEMGSQIAWLLPAAVVLAAAGLWLTRRAPRTDPTRAALLLWGGWLAVTALVFSYMNGIIHPYYTVALAPAIGALTGIGAVLLWRRRTDALAAAVLAGVVGLTAIEAYVLLDDTTTRLAVLVAGLAAAALLFLAPALAARARAGVAALAVVAVLAGPAWYSLQTAATPHTGAIPAAGPAATGGPGGGAVRLRRAGGGGGHPAGAAAWAGCSTPPRPGTTWWRCCATATATRGRRPPSAPTTRPATSWRAGSR